MDAFEEELLDRFGPLPADAEAVLAHARIRLSARALRVERIDAGAAAIALTPGHDFVGDAAQAGLIEKDRRFLLTEPTEQAERSGRVEWLLEALERGRPV